MMPKNMRSDYRCEIHDEAMPCKTCREALGVGERPNIYVRHGYFSQDKKCPIHDLPLALWHRLGKWECPQRMCPYTEKHDCEWRGVPCLCDPDEDDLETDDMDVRASRIVAHYEESENCSTEFLDRFRDLAKFMAWVAAMYPGETFSSDELRKLNVAWNTPSAKADGPA